MSVVVLRFAALLYATAAASYVLFFARPRHRRVAAVGYGLLAAGFVVHAVSIGLACKEWGGAEFLYVRGGIGLLGWLASGAFLLIQRFWPLPSVGAFVVPLVLTAVLPGVFELGRQERGSAPAVLGLPTTKVHVFSAVGGIAIFGIACIIALMYLLQEREVKGKRFGALFSRLPDLNALARLNQRLVRSGFTVYSVALVTGALVAKKTLGSFWTWDFLQVTVLVTWLLYGAMVQLRHMGIHGRRYALLTLAGFPFVLMMFAVGALPSLSRHGGSFQ
jgi:ABC-type transport system involved in cytochrome c biogenesis permease subunit